MVVHAQLEVLLPTLEQPSRPTFMVDAVVEWPGTRAQRVDTSSDIVLSRVLHGAPALHQTLSGH
jgi:hypothetical protein